MWAHREWYERYTRTSGIVPPQQSYKSHKSYGLGYGDLLKVTEVPGAVRACYITRRSSGYIVAPAYINS